MAGPAPRRFRAGLILSFARSGWLFLAWVPASLAIPSGTNPEADWRSLVPGSRHVEKQPVKQYLMFYRVGRVNCIYNPVFGSGRPHSLNPRFPP